ncbi:MAG: transposase [Syntrophaceae bacterium]|nr:transposase [Syntrophaceae bacterium]
MFWDYVAPHWAGEFLDRWRDRTMQFRIKPMMRVARILRSHRELLLNWFRSPKAISSGVMEGLQQ